MARFQPRSDRSWSPTKFRSNYGQNLTKLRPLVSRPQFNRILIIYIYRQRKMVIPCAIEWPPLMSARLAPRHRRFSTELRPDSNQNAAAMVASIATRFRPKCDRNCTPIAVKFWPKCGCNRNVDCRRIRARFWSESYWIMTHWSLRWRSWFCPILIGFRLKFGRDRSAPMPLG